MLDKENLPYKGKQVQEFFNENVQWCKLTDEEKEFEDNLSAESTIMAEDDCEEDYYDVDFSGAKFYEDDVNFDLNDEAEELDDCIYIEELNEILSELKYGRTKEGKIWVQYNHETRGKVTYHIKCPNCGYDYFVYNGKSKDGQIIQCKNKECRKKENGKIRVRERGYQFTIKEYIKVAYIDRYLYELVDKGKRAKEICDVLVDEEISNSMALECLETEQQENVIIKLLRMGATYNALRFLKMYSSEEIDESVRFFESLGNARDIKIVVTLMNKGIDIRKIKKCRDDGFSLDAMLLAMKDEPLKYKKERHITKGLTTIYKYKRDERYKNYQLGDIT